MMQELLRNIYQFKQKICKEFSCNKECPFYYFDTYHTCSGCHLEDVESSLEDMIQDDKYKEIM